MPAYLATNSGVYVCDQDQNWSILHHGLAGQHITSIAAQDSFVVAGTTAGIYRSINQGRSWVEAGTGLLERHIRWMAAHPNNSGIVFAGTEPADIFLSADGGLSWWSQTEVRDLRDRFGWSLPYSPEAGCVRGFALSKIRLYAAVEVGGVLCSNDGGHSWQLAGGSSGRPDLGPTSAPWIHPDVHSIEIHPSSPDLVYAPTGGGFYRSWDGGSTWQLLYRCYCRAVWVDPNDSDHLVLGPADGVDRNGRIEESRDGGKTWLPASTGLSVPWQNHMVERFTQSGSDLLAVLSNGQVLSAQLDSLQWRVILAEIKEVNALVIA